FLNLKLHPDHPVTLSESFYSSFIPLRPLVRSDAHVSSSSIPPLLHPVNEEVSDINLIDQRLWSLSGEYFIQSGPRFWFIRV
ncbi:hypothetical protein JXQ70_12315, partial [bacterium]|nr:hypothetical protein [bacterium]